MKCKFTLIELLVGISILAILLALCTGLIGRIPLPNGFYRDYSTGVRSGHLMKVSKKGIAFKSYEAEVQIVENIAVTSNQNESANNTKVFWQVSTRDEEIGLKLEDLVGKEVKIRYTQYLIKPFTIDSDYEIVSYEEIK